MTLQARANGTSKWISRATGKTTKAGNYKFKTRIVTNTQLRVVVNGTTKLKARASQARLVNARQALKVSTVSNRNIDPGNSFTVKGTASSDDVWDPSQQVRASIRGDDTQLWAKQPVAYGTSTPVSLNLRGVLRLRLDATPIQQKEWTKPVFGNARVHCLFDE